MEFRKSYKKDDIIDYHECRVTQVITSQTLSPKKTVTNELRTPLFFSGIIGGMVDDVDNTIIQFVNNLFETTDKEKSLVDNTIDYLKKRFNIGGQ